VALALAPTAAQADTTITVGTAGCKSPSAAVPRRSRPARSSSEAGSPSPHLPVTGLKPRTKYFYELRASSPFGSLTSAAFSFSTPPNTFAILSVREDSRGRILVTVRVPAAGRLHATASAKGKHGRKLAFGPAATARARGAGKASITLRPGTTFKSAVGSGRRVRVIAAVSFTPTHGRATRKTASLRYRRR